MSEYIKKAEAIERALYAPIMSSGPIDEKDIDAWLDGTTDAQKQIAKSIGKIPAEDVVEVVRCKDCCRRYDVNECPKCFLAFYVSQDHTTDDGFCHRGERKADHERVH